MCTAFGRESATGGVPTRIDWQSAWQPYDKGSRAPLTLLGSPRSSCICRASADPNPPPLWL